MRSFILPCIFAVAFISSISSQIIDPDCLNEIKSSVDACNSLVASLREQKKDNLLKAISDFESLRGKMKLDCSSEVGLTIFNSLPAFDSNCNRLANKLDETLKGIATKANEDDKFNAQVNAVNFCHEVIDQVAAVCVIR